MLNCKDSILLARQSADTNNIFFLICATFVELTRITTRDWQATDRKKFDWQIGKQQKKKEKEKNNKSNLRLSFKWSFPQQILYQIHSSACIPNWSASITK